ncbi:hypothetical protein Tsubulata_016276 [Turnera subulata]|uniref:Condensin complex subunit 1 C-terminal domain-containing protein n=1 Tax=Turnera subulata TaxID=218843 RepID=A0A9Q0FM70_9ROSI|nr:hypothetical protein Tsubulata_016276 [Turnera subulata]
MDDTITSIIADLEETQLSNDNKLSSQTLQNLQSLLDSNDPQLIDQLFSTIPPSSLLPPLTATMDSAHSPLSLHSSNAYLSLLLAPNSPVFTLFNPMSFLSLLRSLRVSLKPRPAGPQNDEEEPNSSSSAPVPARGALGKKRKGRGARNCEGGGGSGGKNEGLDVRVFFRVIEKLAAVLDLVHLDRFPDSLRSLVQTIVEIPVTASEAWGNVVNFNRLGDLCSRVLSQLIKPEHGEEGETAAEVLKSLTPLTLRVKSQAGSFALGFVKSLVVGVTERSDGVKKAVVNFPRFLVQKAPEKAELRGMAVEAIMAVVRAMALEDQIGFAEYVVKMTQGKASLRLLGVDLIFGLMTELKDPFGVGLDDGLESSWGFKCLGALIQRCSDSGAAIRARALSNLAQLVGFLSSDDKHRAVLKEAMGFGAVDSKRMEGGLNDVLRKRCMDEKANVRRAALVLVSKLTALLGGNFDGVLLKTMGMACSDPLVSIRKAAISALSECILLMLDWTLALQAFRVFSDQSVITEWLHSVPRLVTDNESSIQEECENLFLELVLDRISEAGAGSNVSNGSTPSNPRVKGKSVEREMELLFPKGALLILREICNGEVEPWVKKICTSLGKKKLLKPKIVVALQNIIKTSESHWLSHSMSIEQWTAPPGAWLLLAEVSAYLSKSVDWGFLYHHWRLLDKYRAAGELKSPPAKQHIHEDDSSESNSAAWAGDRVFLLQTISNVSVELPPEPAAELAENLLKRIEEFNMHSTEVNAHVKALRTLCKRKASNTSEADALVTKWVQQILSRASLILEKFLSSDSEGTTETSFFTPRTGNRKGKRAAIASRLLPEAVTAVFTIGSLVVVCPSADLTNIVPLLHTIITSGSSDPKVVKLPGPSVSLKQTAPSLYIQAWLTMGKICLADGKLAKNYIPLFVQELEKSDCAALRNNLVVMMADFCVRYTALIDCYISKITLCLRDPCELVRRQTFILLSRLLQRDYVKWRGVLFLRFLLSLVDESEKIRQLADFLFGNILKVKAPLLAYNSFVEAIFVLNNHNAKNTHGSKISQKENRLFSIRGNDETSRSKRMHIYTTLLKQMAPEHLLATFAKLCAEILAAASDGMLKIEDATGQSVLQDAFQILSSKEIRPPTCRGPQNDAGDIEEEGGENGASAIAAKGRAITQAVRKGLIQNTIPIFIELKRLLESMNSPLIGSLMECLRILLKDYKNEIDDILVADKQLQKELIYDMQKYESAKARSTVAEAVSAMQNPSSFVSPKATGGTHAQDSKLAAKLASNSRVASAMADAAAAAKAKSVLREVNRGPATTPPLSAISVPKLKSNQLGTIARNERPPDVLESLRRRQSFNFDDEN